MKRVIDHIVYCVPNLESALDDLENRLGIRPVFGGRHLTKGTKNALLNLGNGCYLEILAVDEENDTISGPRWMGIDLIATPKITRWCLKSDMLQTDSEILKSYALNLGHQDQGSRMTSDGKLLVWNMILPASHPEVELVPFMVDWSKSEMHPCDALTEKCTLQSIHLHHSNPIEIQPTLDALGWELNIDLASQAHISIDIQSPKGLVRLG